MKREVERESKLPAFSISIGDFEVLWERLLALFPSEGNLYAKMEVLLPGETVEFESFEEFKNYKGLPPVISKFRIWMRQGERSISVRTYSLWYGKATISAKAEMESWCAGAIEVASSFAQMHKAWYHWLVVAPLGVIAVVFANIPLLATQVLHLEYEMNLPMFIGWILAAISLSILYFARERLFPPAKIRLSESGGFIRKYSAELGLALAVASLILTVVGLFTQRSDI